MNEKGVVAGNGWTETGAFPFTYDSEKKEFTSIPNIPNTTFTGVWAINDLGVLVGFTSFDGNTEVGLILRRHNSYTTLVNPNAFTFTEPRGINNEGMVTGWFDTADGLTTGWLYEPKTKTYTNFLPSNFTLAQGINSLEDIVGSVYLDDGVAYPGSAAGIYGFLRSRTGAVKYFQVNGTETHARGITDSRIVTGFACDSSTCYGFITRLKGLPFEAITISNDDLISPPGYATYPQGIAYVEDRQHGCPGFGYDLEDLAIAGIVIDAEGHNHGFVAFHSK
ncbi:MAG TPA: hypothetical protein VFG53_01505 [Anaeromyxobacter sp.]|nr:hypothetical protein [Anaeromyxobacter sp.]